MVLSLNGAIKCVKCGQMYLMTSRFKTFKARLLGRWAKCVTCK